MIADPYVRAIAARGGPSVTFSWVMHWMPGNLFLWEWYPDDCAAAGW